MEISPVPAALSGARKPYDQLPCDDSRWSVLVVFQVVDRDECRGSVIVVPLRDGEALDPTCLGWRVELR